LIYRSLLITPSFRFASLQYNAVWKVNESPRIKSAAAVVNTFVFDAGIKGVWELYSKIVSAVSGFRIKIP